MQLPAGPVAIRIWTMDVGRVKLLFLDTNTPLNTRPEDRAIASQLYGGDNDTRIRQEIVLGIGGMRALEALGYKPTVFHMNEGHSAFLAIERIRLLIERQKLTFDEALEATRVNNVFTTHTPVPAGIDLFDPGLVYHYFNQYLPRSGHRFRPFHGARPAQSAGWRRAALDGDPRAQYVGLPQRREPPAPACLAGDVARLSGPRCRSGKRPSPRSPTASTCRAGSTAIWPTSTISTSSPTGATAGTIPASGSRSGTSRMKNCWRCTAAASAA